MRRSALLALAIVALLLAGCGARQPGPKPVGRTTPRPVAVLLATQDDPPPVGALTVTAHYEHAWLVALDGSRAATLPMRANSQGQRLSPDGRSLLYSEATMAVYPRRHPLRARRIGTDSREDTLVADGWLQDFGWTAEGEPVLVYGEPTGHSYDEGPLGGVRVDVLGPAARHRVIPAAETTRVTDVRLVAARGPTVYLQAFGRSTATGEPQWMIWRFDLATGRLDRLYEMSTPHGDLARYVEYAGKGLPSATLLDKGVPFEHLRRGKLLNGKPAYTPPAVERTSIVRLPDMRELRSDAVTPPATYDDPHRPVYDPTLERYSVATSGDSEAGSMWETDARSGESRVLVEGTAAAARPLPLGYVGDDVLYKAEEDGQLVVRLFERATGATRALAVIGPAFEPRPPWYSQVRLLGVMTDGGSR